MQLYTNDRELLVQSVLALQLQIKFRIIKEISTIIKAQFSGYMGDYVSLSH
jgi:hypothetical protein